MNTGVHFIVPHQVFRPGAFVRRCFATLSLAMPRLFGLHGIHPKMDAVERVVAFNDFQRDFQPNVTYFDWISRDQNEVQEYKDENCGHI